MGRKLLAFAVVVLLIIGGGFWYSHRHPKDPYKAQAYRIARPYRFHIPAWETRALLSEASERVVTRIPAPDSQEAHDLVIDYLKMAQQIGGIEGDIERLAAEHGDDSRYHEQMRALQAKVDQLRALQRERRPVVERILERQVSTILSEEHLGWLGYPLPPVAFQFTEPPYYFILSPRDRIELRVGIHLRPQLPLSTREHLEEEAERSLPNTSALVEGIGGFSTWPTMIIDRASLEWVLSTIAHEWTHTYLILFPLGRRYYKSPNMSAINETVADIVGNEVGHKALVRFYPEHVPPTPTPTPIVTQVKPLPTPTPTATPTPEFDFVREMRITREHVDELLAQGKVREAEMYMEQRRRFFVEHGYYIRKLNQAYFAFHGTYRTGPAAPSKDPIGPRLRKLRAQSPSLRDFLHTVRGIRSMEDLLRLVPEP